MNPKLISYALITARTKMGLTRYKMKQEVGVDWRTYKSFELNPLNKCGVRLLTTMSKLGVNLIEGKLSLNGKEFTMEGEVIKWGEDSLDYESD